MTAIGSAIFNAELAIAAPPVVDSRDLTFILAAHFGAMRLAISTTFGLEVCETLAATAFDALRLVAATPLNVSYALLAATNAF